MTSAATPPNPFSASGMIDNLSLFVGRKDEIRQIISRMEGAQPTSINIYGEKRIGKSSLLYHFYLTWENLVQNPSRYVVIFLSLQNAQTWTENQFYQAVAEELLKSATVMNNSALSQPLQVTTLDRVTFSDAIKEWKKQGVLPVLCLDDFKRIFENRNVFNNDFYNNLRYLMDSSSLMLVIVSEAKLDVYSEKYKLTSNFFNLGHLIKLGELTEEETKDLLLLPASTVSNAVAVLGVHDQNLCKQLAGKHPFLLQLAGSLACEARQMGKDEDWIRRKFDLEKRRLPKKSFKFSWRGILREVWLIFSRIGAFSLWLADIWNNSKAGIFGIVIVVIIVLIIFGFFNKQQVVAFLQYLLNLVK
ncbi:MAG TPA: ATP-binding protein [Nostocaceae cyanobacterium]|nr:ATP-binding protein [Nostocaceae cyanobacterium]